jgi:hypothetical protein
MDEDSGFMFSMEQESQDVDKRRRETIETLELVAELNPVRKRRIEISRRRLEGAARLFQDYFGENPT